MFNKHIIIVSVRPFFSTFEAPSNALQEETEPVEQSHFTPDILTDWDHRQWQGKLSHSKQKGVSGSSV